MTGRLDRLASLFEMKLQALAIHPSQMTKEAVLKDVAEKIKDIYRSRIIVSKDNILQFLANAGSLFAKNLINDMTYLAADVHKLIQQPFQDQLLLEMANCRRDILDNKEEMRQAVHHAVKVNRESDRNYREQLKSKLEQTLWRIERMLIEQGDIVKDFCTPEAAQLASDILSGQVSPKRRELNKEKLLMFSRTPMAAKYGFDHLDILQKLLEDPEMKIKLTTLINAVDRGHFPKDGEAILQEAQQIARQMPPEVSPIHEMPEDEAQRIFRAKLDPSEHWSEEMHQRKKELAEENANEPIDDPEKLEQQIQERDQSWEEKMMSKYNNLALIYKSLRREG